MPTLLASMLVLIALPLGQTPALASSGSGRITGRVVASDTVAIVRGATVTLLGQNAATWSGKTDAEGRFSFGSLPAGSFRVRVAKAGFVTTTFGLDGRQAGPIALGVGQVIDRGDLALPRGGVITGRLFDEFGEPAAGVNVQALRSSYLSPGERRLQHEGSAQTNDLGDYRIFGLKPGQYFVAASLRQMQFGVAEAGTPAPQFAASSQGSAPTFYPGTANGGDARSVDVSAGRETSGIDVSLLAVALARVSGTVVDSTGKPAAGMFVWLNTERSDGGLFAATLTADIDAAGRFTVPNVAPGNYRVDVVSIARMEAIATSGSGGIGQSLDGQARESASVPISINGQDVEGLAIQTGPGARLTGAVTIDGKPASGTDLSKASVSLLAPRTGISATLQAAYAPIKPDGTFSIASSAGLRMPRLSGLPVGLWLKSVVARGIDVTDAGFEIGNEDIPNIQIELTSSPARVKGAAKDATGAPVKQFVAVIFAEEARVWGTMMNRRVVSARAAEDGTFVIANLPAGSYFAIALDQVTDGEWAEPANLEKLKTKATSFKISDGELKELSLVVVKALS
jgi:hypothetical protein